MCQRHVPCQATVNHPCEDRSPTLWLRVEDGASAMRQDDDEAGRLLLIPFAPGIGDMVMMEPLLRAVRRGLPEWQITMAAKEYAEDLLPPEGYQLVTPPYIVTEAPRPLRPIHRLVPQRLIAWAAEPALSLDLGPFERTINLFWVWESRIPFDRWWTPQWPLKEGVIHTVDLLASYLEEELEREIPREERRPRLRPGSEELSWAADHVAAGFPRPGKQAVALIPVASDALKWWEPRKWAEINDEMAAADWNTVLVAPHEHAHAQDVFSRCATKPLWPDLNLRQLIALLARMDLAIGVDTGPLHVASALGTPWIGLFGATNPDLIGPYDREHGVPLVARFPKAPSCDQCWLAFKNRDDRCLTLPGTGCATMVPVSDVLDAVESALTGTPLASAYSGGDTEGR